MPTFCNFSITSNPTKYNFIWSSWPRTRVFCSTKLFKCRKLLSETVKKCRNTFVILVANAIKPENEVQFTALKNHTTNERCNKYKTTWKSALQDWKGQKCQEIAWSFFSGLDTEMIQTVKKTLMKTFRFDMERNKATMGRGTTWLYRRYVECSGFCDQCALRCYNSTKAGGLLQGKHIKKLIRKTKVYIRMTLFGPFSL